MTKERFEEIRTAIHENQYDDFMLGELLEGYQSLLEEKEEDLHEILRRLDK